MTHRLLPDGEPLGSPAAFDLDWIRQLPAPLPPECPALMLTQQLSYWQPGDALRAWQRAAEVWAALPLLQLTARQLTARPAMIGGRS